MMRREKAPAKLNLTLHVTGRRADGYHLLDSLVAFPRVGDSLAAAPAEESEPELVAPEPTRPKTREEQRFARADRDDDGRIALPLMAADRARDRAAVGEDAGKPRLARIALADRVGRDQPERAAAAQQFYNSLTPDQRAELDQLAQQAFGSPDLMNQLAQMDSALREARPGLDWDGGESFSGDQQMGLGQGAAALRDISELDALSEQLSQQYAGARMDDIDLDALARQLGDQAAVDARTLAELEKALTEQGFFDRTSDGTLRLSPKAMRQLGQTIFRDIADQMSGRRGDRQTRKSGLLGEPTGATREWEFGDTDPWDVTRTVSNAVLRTISESSDPVNAPSAMARDGVHISVRDVEVADTEARTQAAVVLLVDTSFSMEMEGRWTPMKRTAIALNHLISTRFRSDELEVIAFGRYARSIDIAELTGLQPRMEQGTNLHHALLLAQRHLRRFPNAQPVVLVVTDGEPTAHLDPSGEPFFFYPPHPQTIALTVRELDHVARMGAQVTFFRLGEDPGLAHFMDQIARRIGGRVVAPDVDGLGAAVVGDYLRSRRPRRG